jgi:hypothetical protein
VSYKAVKADLLRGLAGALTTRSCISAVIELTPNLRDDDSIRFDCPIPLSSFEYLFSKFTVQVLQISLSAFHIRWHSKHVPFFGYSSGLCLCHLPLGQYEFGMVTPVKTLQSRSGFISFSSVHIPFRLNSHNEHIAKRGLTKASDF